MKKLDFSKLDLCDALDLAVLIEQEAEERYIEFSEKLGDRYKGDASELCRFMAVNEAKHGAALQERRERLFGPISSRPSKMNRDMFFDAEAPDQGKPRAYMSPRQAIQMALDAEKKAYDFFDSAIPYLTNSEVKMLFLELKQEELEHQELLSELLEKLPPSEGPDLDDDDLDEPPAL